jgi:hypothetical protein
MKAIKNIKAIKNVKDIKDIHVSITGVIRRWRYP